MTLVDDRRGLRVRDDLLIETRISDVRLVESDTPGICRFEADVSEAEYVNANNRKYRADVLERAFEEMNAQIALHPGAVDHPDWTGLSITDLGIVWEQFWREGMVWKGRGRTIDTAKGRDLRAALEAGVPIGFSTRGWGKGHEEKIDGRTVLVLDEFSFNRDGQRGGVDAVVNPSVRHARVTSVRKEDEDQMEKELKEAQEELAAAQKRIAELESELAQATSRADESEKAKAQAESERDDLKSRVETLESELADFRKQADEAALEAKLVALTKDHRFGASIREGAKEIGVTLENAELVVAAVTKLIEAAASAANEGNPRGVIQTDEDAEPKRKSEIDLESMGL